DNYVGHIHVKVYNNGERESFSCNDIFVIRELRDKGLGSEITLKTFLAAAKEAKLRGIKPAKWVSVYYSVNEDTYDNDWEFNVVPLIGLLESLGFDDYLAEFESGKLRDTELLGLMQKHSKRNRKLQGTYYNTLNNLRIRFCLKMTKRFFVEICYAIWNRLKPSEPALGTIKFTNVEENAEHGRIVKEKLESLLKQGENKRLTDAFRSAVYEILKKDIRNLKPEDIGIEFDLAESKPEFNQITLRIKHKLDDIEIAKVTYSILSMDFWWDGSVLNNEPFIRQTD
ncbi:unnamed protein product, partial [marine sediment metagenome]